MFSNNFILSRVCGGSRVLALLITILDSGFRLLVMFCLGPAYDLSVTEIRDDSLVVEWKAPVYIGASAITGYYVDKCKTGTDTWTTTNTSAVNHCYLKVLSLVMST